MHQSVSQTPEEDHLIILISALTTLLLSISGLSVVNFIILKLPGNKVFLIYNLETKTKFGNQKSYSLIN